MTAVLHWLPRGPAVALDDGNLQLSFDALHARVAACADALRASGLCRIASLADNGIDWLIADLAMLDAGIVHVPLPSFFTTAQLAGASNAAGAEAMLLDPVSPLQRLFAAAQANGSGRSLAPSAADPAPVAGLDTLQLAVLADAGQPHLPDGTAKVTFTSGSTGAPKGVCLGAEGLLKVVDGVNKATQPLHIRHHLCALPLAVLLENVAGAMVALAKGATVHLRPAAALGWRGAAGFDAAPLDRVAREAGAESLILMPQMLRAWTAHLVDRQITAPEALRLVAVGGAAVGAQAILDARLAGLPAFEGYGLSEGGSVQTLNLPGADRPGSVGRALPHAHIHSDAQGHLQAGGSLMLGYIGQPVTANEALATGDVGEIDADGFVWVRGRRDNLIITGLGRNVSPEWIESLLRESRYVAEAIVLPDQRGGLRAVIWPTTGVVTDAPGHGRASGLSDADIDTAIAATNSRLPDYARLGGWMHAKRPLDASSGLATPGGKPLRAAIAAAHPEPLDQPLHETHA